ncbi:hypothetical protein A2U01_0102446, partial [Trifolium medium]|nr:hypothetical protein [Trifolium medium]
STSDLQQPANTVLSLRKREGDLGEDDMAVAMELSSDSHR